MLKTFYKSTDGYILPYILFIAILVVSLLLSLVSIVFFNHMAAVRKINKKRLELACYSAVQKHISGIITIKEGTELIDIDSTNVLLEYKYHGFFYQVTASAKKNRDSVKVQYLFTNRTVSPFDNAIIISRPNLRASAAGITHITGNIFCTTDRITRDNISGISMASGDYHDGKLIVSENIKAKLYIDSLYKVLKSHTNPAEEGSSIPTHKTIIRQIEELELDERTVSILDSADVFVISNGLSVKGRLKLPGKSMLAKKFIVRGPTIFEKGTICNVPCEIICDSSIVFEGDSNIEDLVAFASKKIEVKAGTKFTSSQLVSENKINITNSLLLYPSIIGLYVDAGSPKNLDDEINITSSIINGTVFLTSSTVGLGNNRSRIKIDQGSKVNGLIYSENNAELQCQVTGTVYTYNFRFYKEPTEYINWMVNLNVDRTKLSNWFLLPLGFSKELNLEMLKEQWIY